MDADTPVADWQVHLQTVGSVLAMLAGALLVASLAISLGSELLQSLGFAMDGPLAQALTSVFQFLGFGVAIAAYLQLTDDWELIRWRVPTARDVLWMVGGLFGLFALLAAATVLMQALGLSSAESQIVTTGRESPAYLLYLVPVTVLLVGPTEELIFRGIIQGSLSRAYGPVVGVLVASAIFASIHLPSLHGEGWYVTIAVIFVLGATLGTLYEYTDNILIPIVVHGLFNAVQFLMQYATQVGMLK